MMGFKLFEKIHGCLRSRLPSTQFHIFGLLVYILIFYALGIPSSNPEFYIVVFFIATAVQDAAASFSVGSLKILLASIFLTYGINPGIRGIAAAMLRSAAFWFPLFVGFVCVQIVGAKNLLVARPDDLKRGSKDKEMILKNSNEELTVVS